MAGYKVVLSKRASKGLARLSPAARRTAEQVIETYLTTTPLTPIPGKTKRLRGKLAYLMQYDLSYGDRLWYWVDQAEHKVYIEYIGPHP
ncbi:MAG TPA: hypothetical protein ENJ31_09710 [Anaerolineae bacterium]|nr:hypothetical protein [Anaerolineae bacterium]